MKLTRCDNCGLTQPDETTEIRRWYLTAEPHKLDYSQARHLCESCAKAVARSFLHINVVEIKNPNES
jgi:hypothetical protein